MKYERIADGDPLETEAGQPFALLEARVLTASTRSKPSPIFCVS
jgi:hypothetical protein